MNESASGFIKRNMPLVLACSFILNAFIPAFAATKQKSYHDREYEKHMERVAKENYPSAGKKHTPMAIIRANRFFARFFTSVKKICLIVFMPLSLSYLSDS